MRRILFFTSTRADYGILRPLLAHLHEHPDVDLGLLVTGTHLEASHGHTIDTIVDDGYPIVARCVMLDPASPPSGPATDLTATAAAIGRAVSSSVETLVAWRPDVAVVLGDRFEALAFAVACHMARTPLAHLHGGEVTIGAIDDAFRHSITKMATLHLVASEEFGRRVAQLGEHEERIHVVGALGLDAISLAAPRLAPLPRDERRFLVSIHPTTLVDEPVEQVVDAIVSSAIALEHDVLFTAPNADPGGQRVRQALSRHLGCDNVSLIESIGPLRFPEVVYSSAAIVGNSSAGIIEAPFLGTPTVNIGCRQDGRPRAASVIDVPLAGGDPARLHQRIEAALQRALALKADLMPFAPTPYGAGGAGERAVAILTGDLPPATKGFVDLPNPTSTRRDFP